MAAAARTTSCSPECWQARCCDGTRASATCRTCRLRVSARVWRCSSRRTSLCRTPKVYNVSTNCSAVGPRAQDKGKLASTWPFYLECYTAAAAMQAGFVEDGLSLIEHIGLLNLRLGLAWAQNLWNLGFLTYVTAPVTWFVPDVLGAFALDASSKTLSQGWLDLQPNVRQELEGRQGEGRGAPGVCHVPRLPRHVGQVFLDRRAVRQRRAGAQAGPCGRLQGPRRVRGRVRQVCRRLRQGGAQDRRAPRRGQDCQRDRRQRPPHAHRQREGRPCRRRPRRWPSRTSPPSRPLWRPRPLPLWLRTRRSRPPWSPTTRPPRTRTPRTRPQPLPSRRRRPAAATAALSALALMAAIMAAL